MRDIDFFNRRDAIADSIDDDLNDGANDGIDRIALTVACLTDAVLLLAQVLQERPDSGATDR